MDLDGTLLDTWRRHWGAYCKACETVGVKPIPFTRFKALKREGPDAAAALLKGLDARAQKVFQETQLRWIEDPKLLSLDRPFTGSASFLLWAGKHFDLRLATSRHSEARAARQLKSLGLRTYFTQVVLTNGRQGRPADKAALARRSKTPSLWVGDTEAEAAAARSAEAPFFACGRGIRNPGVLSRFKPRIIFTSYAALRRALAPWAAGTKAGRPIRHPRG